MYTGVSLGIKTSSC